VRLFVFLVFLALAPISAQAAICDTAQSAGTPCAVAFSTYRALYSNYTGNLFELKRNDGALQNIGLVNGFADINTANQFCSGHTCNFYIIYDQSPNAMHLYCYVFASTGAQNPLMPTYATTTTPNGKTVPYALNGFCSAGSRAFAGASNGQMPTGASAVTELEVTSGASLESNCCYDFGEAEASIGDTGRGHMFAILPSGNDYRLRMDIEDGIPYQNEPGSAYNIFTSLIKTNGTSVFSEKWATDGKSLAFATWGDTGYPCPVGTVLNNVSMSSCLGAPSSWSLEGGLTMGVGGDGAGGGGCGNPGGACGAFIEGEVFVGQTSDATDNSAQSDINNTYSVVNGATASLTANPTTINPGQSSTLTWNSSGAASCTGTNFNTGNATSGSTSVSPTTTTTYSVNCSGATASATVVVQVAINDPGFEAANTLSPYWATSGIADSFSVDTTTANAHSGNNSGLISDSTHTGNFIDIEQAVGVVANTSYVLSAWLNASGTTEPLLGVKTSAGKIVADIGAVNGSGYQQYSVSFNSCSNTSLTVFAGYLTPGTASSMHMDDFSITSDPPHSMRARRAAAHCIHEK